MVSDKEEQVLIKLKNEVKTIYRGISKTILEYLRSNYHWKYINLYEVIDLNTSAKKSILMYRSWKTEITANLSKLYI